MNIHRTIGNIIGNRPSIDRKSRNSKPELLKYTARLDDMHLYRGFDLNTEEE